MKKKIMIGHCARLGENCDLHLKWSTDDHREKATTIRVRALVWFETGMRSKDK